MTDTTLQPESPRPRHCGRGFAGPLIIIALGVIFLLDQFHIVSAGYVFQYFWPAVFIIIGIELLSHPRGGRRAVWGVIAILAGGGLILNNIGYWSFDIGNLWPLILIAVGLSLLFRRSSGFGSRPVYTRRHAFVYQREPGAGTTSDESFVDGFATLGGYQRRITSQQFTGGRLTALFGGVQLDLTRAEIAGAQANIEVSAMFGGVEIRVPERWEVEIHGQPILGGFSDETHQLPAASPKRLVIDGWAAFGGVVIKN